MHFPQLFGIVKGRLLPHANGINLIFLHYLGEGRIEEHQLPNDVYHVNLSNCLITGLNILLHAGPLRMAVDVVEELFDV